MAGQHLHGIARDYAASSLTRALLWAFSSMWLVAGELPVLVFAWFPICCSCVHRRPSDRPMCVQLEACLPARMTVCRHSRLCRLARCACLVLSLIISGSACAAVRCCIVHTETITTRISYNHSSIRGRLSAKSFSPLSSSLLLPPSAAAAAAPPAPSAGVDNNKSN